ncbi:MAG: ABC transporter ATP-binding protein, partial [Gammaproteobacteria bacterium]|nr:ABC transporter ATP-binding protein [Gammaproteobacteria bacterium]
MQAKPNTPKAHHAGLFELTGGFRGLYLASIAAMAVGIGLLFLVPRITKDVIDGFVSNGEGGYDFVIPDWIAGYASTTTSALAIAGASVILATTVAGLFQYFKGRWAAVASEGIMRRLRNTLHGHLAALPTRFFDKSETGDLVQRCTSDVETVRVFLASQVVEIGRSILLIVCVTPVLFGMSVKLAWVTLALLPVLIIYSLFFFSKLIHIFTEVDEAEGKLTTVLQENLTGIRVVRSFGRGEFE